MSEREDFYQRLNEIIAGKNKNNVYMSEATYKQILIDVNNAKEKEHFKTALDYRRLKRYDTITIGKEKRLIFPLASSTDNTIKYFVATEELFDIIHNAHISIGHGGRNRLIKELSDKYKNITTEAVVLYLSLCQACQSKPNRGIKKGTEEPILSKELSSRAQVDLIDMQTQPDNEFKYILHYQDHFTKFIVLRPLQTKNPAEVAQNLLDIFTLVGAPSILQSNNGRDFVKQVIMDITAEWNGIKMVHAQSRNYQTLERANQDVQNMLSQWLITHKTNRWSTGLKYVQLMRNRAYHHGIRKTPYEGLFRVKIKLGLKTSFLPEDVLTDVHSEEDLTNLIEAVTCTIPVERQSTAQSAMSGDDLSTLSDLDDPVGSESIPDKEAKDNINEKLVPAPAESTNISELFDIAEKRTIECVPDFVYEAANVAGSESIDGSPCKKKRV